MITLTDKQIAEIIGKKSVNGHICWHNADLPEVRIALRAMRLTTADDVFQIDGVMPYWLYLAILAALAPKRVLLNTPNHGPIEIPSVVPSGAGYGVVFTTYEDEHFTLVQFKTPRSLRADQLETIVPPEINPRKGVVISSNAPYWIIGTVAQAYASRTSWLACTQKEGGPIVAISNDRRQELGIEIEQHLISHIIEKAASVPRRGEIWVFDAGYDKHLCLIVSLNERNQKANDILMVPFTSSRAHARRNLMVLPAMSGLSEVSYAQYSCITRLRKENLLGGPISTVKDELIAEIIKHVRRAMGDLL